MNWKDYIAGMLGENSPQDFFHAFSWAVFFAVLSLFYDVMRRDPNSRHSPTHFSLKFFIRDNAIRMMASIMTIIGALRFSDEFLSIKPSAFAGAMIGLCLDRISQYFISLRKKARSNSFKIPNTNMSFVSVGFPTIDPVNDVLTALNSEAFPTGVTATDLVNSDSRFTLEDDEENEQVLCFSKPEADPMPTLYGEGFAGQVAEAFVGPRPPRRRPRPI